MMAASFFEVLILFFFSGQSSDLLSYVEPQVALECLGEKTDDAALEALIAGTAAGDAASDVDDKEAKTAIQNLASRSEALRDQSREKLVAMGEGVRARIEEVVRTDPRRAEEARKVLERLDASKKASAHKAEVARILAIHLAGDRKAEKLVPAVKRHVDAEDPFLRSAARATVAKLGGSPVAAEERPWVASLTAAEALPTENRFLLQAKTELRPADRQVRLGQMLRSMMSKFSMMGGGGSEEEISSAIRQATQQVVDFAVTYGNARVDKVTVANVGGVGPAGGGVGIIFSGEYERAILEKGLASGSGGFTVEEKDGWKVYSSREHRLVLLDDHQVLFLPEEGSKFFPLDDYLKAFREGKKPLRGDARWGKFLDTLGGEAIARGLAITDDALMSEIHRESDGEMPPDAHAALKGMTEIEADLQKSEGKAKYRVEAAFQESKQAEDLAAFVKGGIQMGITELEGQMAQMAGSPLESMMKMALEFLKGIRVVADGKRGIIRGEMDLEVLLDSFFMTLGVRAAPM